VVNLSINLISTKLKYHLPEKITPDAAGCAVISNRRIMTGGIVMRYIPPELSGVRCQNHCTLSVMRLSSAWEP
jgi:hypothetical protein